MYVTFYAHSRQNILVVTQDILFQPDPKNEINDIRKNSAST